MFDEINNEMMDAVTDAVERIQALRNLEILCKVFGLISALLAETGCTRRDEQPDIEKILADRHADLQAAAELLGELAKEVIQTKKAKITIAAMQTAKDAYTKEEEIERNDPSRRAGK